MKLTRAPTIHACTATANSHRAGRPTAMPTAPYMACAHTSFGVSFAIPPDQSHALHTLTRRFITIHSLIPRARFLPTTPRPLPHTSIRCAPPHVTHTRIFILVSYRQAQHHGASGRAVSSRRLSGATSMSMKWGRDVYVLTMGASCQTTCRTVKAEYGE